MHEFMVIACGNGDGPHMPKPPDRIPLYIERFTETHVTLDVLVKH